jgi:hypothetical protein
MLLVKIKGMTPNDWSLENTAPVAAHILSTKRANSRAVRR